MEITSPSGKIYVVGDELGKDERFKLYQCSDGDNQVCVLKIARSRGYNGFLDREAYLLTTIQKEAEELEEEYKLVNKTDKLLNYHFFFPRLVESFISTEQGNSRITIISLAHVATSLSKLSPISHLRIRENVRVDPRSSAWILGKLLKLLVFTHSQNITIGDLDGENILINREEHYVTIFDWTKAVMGNGTMSSPVAVNEISRVALEVTLILGGNISTGKLPKDEQLKDKSYEDFLRNLLKGRDGFTAGEAHQKFYQLIRSMWPTKFHQFNTHIL